MHSQLLGKDNSLKDSWLLILGGLFFVTAGLIHQDTKKPVVTPDKQVTAVNVNQDLLVLMSAGNKRMLADIIWVQTLLESDVDHYKNADLKNWLYLRFKSISKLDPYFYQNYYWGGQYLSIIKDDMQGGLDLLQSGLNIYPNDFNMRYLLGFSYYYELGDYDKGFFHLSKIIDHPKAPKHLSSLLVKMQIEKGFSLNTAMKLIANQLQETEDKILKKKLEAEYYALKAERDLKCLNNKNASCDFLDAQGHAYIKKNGTFYSPLFFLPYRLKKKGDFKHSQGINTIK